MSHDKMFGICENKCLVEVSPKTDTDAVKNRVATLESEMDAVQTKDTQHESRMTAIETKNTEQDTRLTNLETKNTSQDTAIAGKQDKLSTAQQNAVDSGITSAKVSTYDGYASSKQDKLTAGDGIDISNNIISVSDSSGGGSSGGGSDRLRYPGYIILAILAKSAATSESITYWNTPSNISVVSKVQIINGTNISDTGQYYPIQIYQTHLIENLIRSDFVNYPDGEYTFAQLFNNNYEVKDIFSVSKSSTTIKISSQSQSTYKFYAPEPSIYIPISLCIQAYTN